MPAEYFIYKDSDMTASNARLFATVVGALCFAAFVYVRVTKQRVRGELEGGGASLWGVGAALYCSLSGHVFIIERGLPTAMGTLKDI